MSDRYELIEHTADAGIRVRGASLAELFENGAEGLFASMVELEGVDEREERPIEVEAGNVETLFVRWLTELLYYLDAEEMLFRRVAVDEIDETHVCGKGFGERIDRERHDLHFGVKAITRHMLEVRRFNGEYEATVLFDI